MKKSLKVLLGITMPVCAILPPALIYSLANHDIIRKVDVSLHRVYATSSSNGELYLDIEIKCWNDVSASGTDTTSYGNTIYVHHKVCDCVVTSKPDISEVITNLAIATSDSNYNVKIRSSIYLSWMSQSSSSYVLSDWKVYNHTIEKGVK